MKRILLQPVISEKSLMAAQSGWFTFRVGKQTTKPEIAHQIEASFKVNVVGVKTLTVKGTAIRTGRKRLLTMSSPWKKAMVKLKKDQKIELFSVGDTAPSK